MAKQEGFRAKVRSQGRIVIPQLLRESFQIREGDTVYLIFVEEVKKETEQK